MLLCQIKCRLRVESFFDYVMGKAIGVCTDIFKMASLFNLVNCIGICGMHEPDSLKPQAGKQSDHLLLQVLRALQIVANNLSQHGQFFWYTRL